MEDGGPLKKVKNLSRDGFLAYINCCIISQGSHDKSEKADEYSV